MTIRSATKDITAENVYSDAIEIKGQFNFHLEGTWVATVTVQREFRGNDAGTQHDVDTFTANCAVQGNEDEDNVWYRFGVKTGDFTSGTAEGRISQ